MNNPEPIRSATDQQPRVGGGAAWLAALVILSLAGAAILLYLTRAGAGASGDAVQYVQGALNMLAGRGYSRLSGGGEAVPITGFPPVFPAALALAGLISPDLFSAARYLNALLFVLTIFMAGWLTRRISGSALASLLAALLVLCAQNLMRVYSWVMSEGLFIALMLAALILFFLYLQWGSRLLLAAASAAVILSALTRYVGLSLAPAFCLVILFAGRRRLSSRIIDCLIVAAVVLLPFYAWLQRNAALAGTMTNRAVVYHPMSRELTAAFVQEMAAWFIPRQVSLSLTVKSLVLVVPLAALAGWSLLRCLRADRPSVPTGRLPGLAVLTLGLSILAYLAILVLNTTFLDSSTSPEAAVRYLTPVFVLAVILVVSLAVELVHSLPPRRIFGALALAAGLVVATVYGIRTANFIREPGPVFGYTDYRRANYQLVDALAGLDPARLLISNNVELTYFLSGRPAYAMPILYDHYKQQYRDDYEEQLTRANNRLQQGAVIVIIGASDSEEQELLTMLQVQPISTYNDVTLYSR